jgi:hypothetical protein
MTDIDYSKNDEIDINNQLFRRARNNISENSEAIKNLDDDEKSTAEKNLLLYGSEFINNLKQINYTFEQIERYIFIKSKITRKTIKKVIEKGPKAKVEDIKEPDKEELKPLDEPIPELEGKFRSKYEFINRDLDLDLADYEKNLQDLNDEFEKINEEFIYMMADEDLEYDEIAEKGSQNLKDMKKYINDLIEEEEFLNLKIKSESKKIKPTGAGMFIGGVKVKKPRGRPRKTPAITDAEEATKLIQEALTPKKPLAIDAEELEYIDEEDPEAEMKKNEKEAENLDKNLVETVNIGQKTPVPEYASKAYELTISLIQFIGRTTVLYITKIKKNLNYLDEDQIKLIVENYTKLKPNLDMLQYYKDTGGAIIKETLYKQLTKETLGLYNEINDSIRNVKKVKNYTIFSGAGLDHLNGGYFIQSSNPFITHSTTKRFL